MKKQTLNKQLDSKDYEKLGRMLETIYETNYADRKQIYKLSLIKGMLAGFGGVVGATIVVAVILWVLSLFSGTILKPVVDPISETLKGNTTQ